MQGHFYHVLEISNNKPYSREKNSPDPDAPELPPPLEAHSQDTKDTPPVYQDITELSSKHSDKLVDCDNRNQQVFEEVQDQKMDHRITEPCQEKVNFVMQISEHSVGACAYCVTRNFQVINLRRRVICKDLVI